ncbi:FG-GAP repeat protein, partial [bacterium]|nr:FG-GAP repeat protein [bacterium]
LDDSILFTGDATTLGDSCGQAVAAAGDVNADGFADLVVSAPRASVSGRLVLVTVISGATTGVLYSWTSAVTGIDHVNEFFGWRLAGAGDVNGDGFADVMIGAPFLPDDGQLVVPGGPWADDFVTVLSGFDGSVLHYMTADSRYQRFGSAVAGIGDFNGDGSADFAIGTRQDVSAADSRGSVRVYSGATGQLLRWLRNG